MIYQFIALILILKIIQQLLYDLYLWQLKEYRLDRIEEHLQRTDKNEISAWLRLTLTAPFSIKKLPKFTAKAMILFVLSLLLLLIVARDGVTTLLWTLLASPGLILISLYCLKPIEWTMRQLVYFLASEKIKKLKNQGLIVIGITGSYGKSTTKSFIHQILSTKFPTLATPGSVNTPFAISHIILKQLNSSHRFFIVEMGAYKRGEIAELCRIAGPNVAIVTGISNQHLALFGSQDNIIKAKSEIFEDLGEQSLALINKSADFLPNYDKKKIEQIIFYGTSEIDKIYHALKGMAEVPEFLKINLEPALILAKIYKIPDLAIKKTLTGLKTPETVVKTTVAKAGNIIIDDSRSSNFKGAIAALDYLKSIKAKKRIVIMSCLVELGKSATENHQQIGKKLEQVADLAIITTGDFFDQIKSGSRNSEKVILLKDPDKIIGKLKSVINSDAAILIEGRMSPKIINYYV